MTPEMRLAQFLSGNEETQKIQSEVRGFSVEELEGLLKTANGDMLQYFQDHPEKLKEKQERDRKKEENKEKKAFTVDHLKAGAGMAATGVAGYALGKHHGKKEKKAFMGADDAIGAAVGYSYGKKQKERGEEHSFGGKQVGSLILPGGIGYQLGRFAAHQAKHEKKDEKLSPQDKVKKADAMGRELAQKEAAVAFGAGKAIGAIGGAAKAVGGAIKGAVKAAPGAIKSAPGNVGNFLKKDWQATKQQFSAGMAGQARPALAKTPVPGIHHNAMPAAPGAAATPKPGMSSGMKMGLVGAGAAAAGVGAGMAGHAAMDRRQQQGGMTRTASIQKEALPSFNQINEGTKIPGRLIKAYEHVKEPVGRALKAVGGKAHGAIKALGSRINSINDPIIKGTAAGSLIGGVGGAVTGAILPDKDEMGNPQRGKTMLRRGIAGTLQGAATGAITGAMHKSSSVQKLQTALEKEAAGLNMAGIGSMAKNFVGSMHSVGQKAMGAVKPMVQNAASSGAVHNGISSLYGAAHKAGQMSMGARAGIGAGVGAAAGAAKGLVAPGRNAQGQQNGRLGSMARGAVGGAALGAGAGAVAPKALGMAGDAAHLARKKVLGLG